MDAVTRERLQRSVGAQRLRTGFARSPDLDLAWACGFPDLLWRDEAPLERSTPRAWYDRNCDPFPVGPWPIEVIHALVNAHLREDEDEISTLMDDPSTQVEPTDEQALLLVERILRDDLVAGFGLGPLLLAIEVLVGADAVVERALAVLASLDDDALTRDAGAVGLFHYVRPMWWRLTPAAHEAAQQQVRALWARVVSQGEVGYRRRKRIRSNRVFAAVLDEMVNGREAIVGNHIRCPWLAALTQDGPFLTGWFAGQTGERHIEVGPAAAFVAREAVLQHYVHCWDEYKAKKNQKLLVATLGTIDDPRVMSWMFEMAMASAAKREAKAWFVAHRASTAAFVESQLEGRYASGAAKLAKAMGI
jgi:hypothetical protein